MQMKMMEQIGPEIDTITILLRTFLDPSNFSYTRAHTHTYTYTVLMEQPLCDVTQAGNFRTSTQLKIHNDTESYP